MSFIRCYAAPLIMTISTASPSYAQSMAYDLATATLSQTLASIARQNNVSMSADPALLKGKTAPAIRGQYSVERAFVLALQGSGLELVKNADGTIYILKLQTPSLTKMQSNLHDAGDLKTIDVVANASRQTGVTNQLPIITVTSEKDTDSTGQFSKQARVGLLGEQKIKDIPFSMSSYTAKALTDAGAVTVADALSKDASVQSTHASGGFLDSFIIRGFPIAEGNFGEVAWDGQYGVAPNYRLLTPYIEKVELLKGPAAMLYGMSPNGGVGGTINVVPKRPLDQPLTRLTLNYATQANLGAHIDLSQRFGEQERFGIRLNASHQQGDTAVDHQSRKQSVLATSLDFKGDRLTSTFDLIWQKEHFKNPIRPYFLAAGVDLPDAPNGKRSATQKWGWSDIEDFSTALQNNYALTENTSVFFNVGGGKSDVGRVVDHTVSILNSKGDTSAMIRDGIFKVDRFSMDAGLRNQFQIGDMDHAITVQLSKYQDKYAMSLPTGPTVYSNIYHPVYIDLPAYNKVGDVPLFSRSKLSGISISDHFSLLDQRLLINLGVRQQYIETDDYRTHVNYKKNALTPLIAATYKINDYTSLYANHIQGLSKGDRAPDGTRNEGETLAPYRSKQYETGLKYEKDDIFAALSVFKINKPSGLVQDNYYSADGEQQNIGVELNGHGRVTPSLSVFGSLAYMDATLKTTSSPTTQGNQAVGVPEWRANIGTEYNFQSLPALTLGGNVTYVDRQAINATNTQYLPAWTRLDLNARYVARLADQDVTFRANLLNALDKNYWSGVASYSTIALGAPRTLSISATLDF